jgi:hypothetical protein
MTVPAGIGREAKTPRPGTVNHGISQNRGQVQRIHHMAQTFSCVGDEDQSIGPQQRGALVE